MIDLNKKKLLTHLDLSVFIMNIPRRGERERASISCTFRPLHRCYGSRVKPVDYLVLVWEVTTCI